MIEHTFEYGNLHRHSSGVSRTPLADFNGCGRTRICITNFRIR